MLGPLAMSERTSAAAADAAVRELGIERAQCYRLLRRLCADLTVTSLLLRLGGSPTGLQLLDTEVEAIIATAVNEVYLDRQCPTPAELMREIERRCVRRNLPPSRRRATRPRPSPRHRRCYRTTGRRRSSTGRWRWSRMPSWLLHREASSAPTRLGKGRAVIAHDLAWAFTWAGRHHPARLVYEAFASDWLDNPWHVARRRRPGPVDFVTLSLGERHLLLATATVLTGPPSLRRMFHPPPGTWEDDLATLARRPRDADRAAFRDRQKG